MPGGSVAAQYALDILRHAPVYGFFRRMQAKSLHAPRIFFGAGQLLPWWRIGITLSWSVSSSNSGDAATA